MIRKTIFFIILVVFQVFIYANEKIIDEANSAFDNGDMKQAYKLYNSLKEKDSVIYYRLGSMSYYGTGILKDYKKSLQLLSQSSEPDAIYLLATQYI